MNFNYKLIDENTSLEITPDYNPLLENTFEDYIHIKEKINFGKRFFNNIENKETIDVQVIGIALNFGDKVEESKLRALLNKRDNLENLYLYADTIIIDRHLHFPQTNITIYARKLIVTDTGHIDTSPLPFNGVRTDGMIPTDRTPKFRTLNGADGSPGGNVNLFVKSYIFPEAGTFFILNGSKGQNGEDGALMEKERIKPLSWEKFKRDVCSYDLIPNYSGKSWNWGDTKEYETLFSNGQVNYIKAEIYNGGQPKFPLIIERGKKNAPTERDGFNAYPSGQGGTGGTAGNLSFLKPIKDDLVQLSSGGGGDSKLIRAMKFNEDGKKNYSINHLLVYRNNLDTWSRYDLINKRNIEDEVRLDIREIAPRPGRDAPGRPGEYGADGKLIKLDEKKHTWLHPNFLENILHYCRDCWLEGDRKPAKWLLSIYSAEFERGKGLEFLNNTSVKNISNKVTIYLNRINNNLDYFGNPVGWIPKLSAGTNISILKKSKATFIQLLYTANQLVYEEEASENKEKQLSFLVVELRKEIEHAKNAIERAYKELPNNQLALNKMVEEIATKLGEIKEFEERARTKLAKDQSEQALFSGILQLAAGATYLIPVGQPFLGKIGSSVLNTISKININSEEPFKEILKTTKGLTEDFSAAIKDNKKEIKNGLLSSLNKEMEAGKKAVLNTDGEIKQYNNDVKESKATLNELFGDKIALLKGKIKGLSTATTLEEASFYESDQYEEMILAINTYEGDLSEIEGLETAEIGELKEKIKELKSSQEGLISNLKKNKDKKNSRSKSIDKATTYFQGLGTGMGKVTEGLETILTPVAIGSEAFEEELAKVINSTFKEEFKKLTDGLDDLNNRKKNILQRISNIANTIATSGQLINDNLIKIAAFNDERANEIESQLNPTTKLFIKEIITDSWELLRAEIYYMMKSFQYRFLRKVDPKFYTIQNIIEDINNFFTKNNTKAPNQQDFEKAFDFVIKGMFTKLALDLLTNGTQNLPSLKDGDLEVMITQDYLSASGSKILQDLTKYNRVSFKFHEVGVTNKETEENKFYYRIRKIEFRSIDLIFSEKTLEKHPHIAKTINLTITMAHSGDSYIRAEDGEYYFFTTRGAESDKSIVQNIQTWTANYSGAKKSKTNSGIENQKISNTDYNILTQLLTDTDKELTYESHLPGATSRMTLSISKPDDIEFEIKSLVFDFYFQTGNYVVR